MLIELEERAGTAENRMESRPSAPKIKPIDRDQSAFRIALGGEPGGR